MNSNLIWRVGAVVCGFGVILGAFGAHALESAVFDWYDIEQATKKLSSWETGVRYQLIHGLALLILGAVANRVANQDKLKLAVILFAIGLLIFSCGLYFWVLTDIKLFVMMVPLGGLAFIVGWLFVWMLRFESGESGADKC